MQKPSALSQFMQQVGLVSVHIAIIIAVVVIFYGRR